MSRRNVDLTNQRFGRLVALKKVPPPNNVKNKTKSYWLCDCDCGNQKIIAQTHLIQGNTESCGRLQKERTTDFNSTKKKYNQYDLQSKPYGIGYTSNGEKFIFDKEDYEKIKDYCWHFNSGGYLVTEDKNGKKLYFHKVVLEENECDGDHINGELYDNRKSSLRKTTHQQNMMNQKLHKNNTSGVSGVSYNEKSNKWVARIGYKMKRIYLGSFINYEDAVNARLEAENEYFGEYSRNKQNLGGLKNGI